MLFFFKNKRVNGLLAALVGGASCCLRYALWVPWQLLTHPEAVRGWPAMHQRHP